MRKSLLIYAFVVVLLNAIDDSTTEKLRKEGNFQCPHPFGLFADPHNCRRFYECSNSVAFDTVCPTPLYFDDALKLCVDETTNLQCGPIDITTQAPAIPDTTIAPTCLLHACDLPDCFCSEDGAQIPGNLLPNEIPQIIILTFTGYLNVLNAEPFGHLLNEIRVNPNGCPIKATFFVSHDYTSYYYVQKLYGQGHEIAMQSITNREPERFWSEAGVNDWVQEVIGAREILHTFTNISREDLVGMRAPFLNPGGNNMMSMIKDNELAYDSSLAAPFSNVPLWPYTMDYHIPHECIAENCPSLSFPGVWEFPLNAIKTGDGAGETCVSLDECILPDDIGVIFDILTHNFRRHYNSNRAPFLLNLHTNWVTDHSKVTALDAFIQHVMENYPDAWFVTMHQALQWMRNPVPSNVLQNFDAWMCPATRQPGCDIPRMCALELLSGNPEVRYIELCGKCPEVYPWLNNIRGSNDGNAI